MIPEKKILVELLKVLPPKTKIYIFGSYAKGTQTKASDIDLALDAGKKLSITEIARIRGVIEALNIPQTVDIVDMNTIPEELKKSILREGVLWSD